MNAPGLYNPYIPSPNTYSQQQFINSTFSEYFTNNNIQNSEKFMTKNHTIDVIIKSKQATAKFQAKQVISVSRKVYEGPLSANIVCTIYTQQQSLEDFKTQFFVQNKEKQYQRFSRLFKSVKGMELIKLLIIQEEENFVNQIFQNSKLLQQLLQYELPRYQETLQQFIDNNYAKFNSDALYQTLSSKYNNEKIVQQLCNDQQLFSQFIEQAKNQEYSVNDQLITNFINLLQLNSNYKSQIKQLLELKMGTQVDSQQYSQKFTDFFGSLQ